MKNRSTKVLLVALFVLATLVMSAVGVSAAVPNETTTIEYTGGDAVKFFKDALDAAENGNVIADVKADLVFSAASDYAKTEIKATSGNIPAGTITVTSSTGNSITMGAHFPQVILYGNFIFKDITYGATAEKVNANGLIFPDGCSGTFGYVDGSAWGGITAGSKRANLAGNVTIYSGSYYIVAGNLYKAGITITEPSVVLRGNARAYQLCGGSYNGASVVSGQSTLKLLDAAYASEIFGGGWFGGTGASGGVNAEIDTTNTTEITRIVSGHVGDYKGSATFNMHIKKCVVKQITGARGTSSAYESYEGFEVNTTIESGVTTKEKIYGGWYNTNAGNAGQNATVRGTFTMTINGGTFEAGVYGASNASFVNSKSLVFDCDTTLTINGGTFSSGVYGGYEIVESRSKVASGSSTVNGTTGQYPANITGSSAFVVNNNPEFKSVVFGGSRTVTAAQFKNYTVNVEIYGGTFKSTLNGGAAITSGADSIVDYSAVTNIIYDGGTYEKGVYSGSLVEKVGTAASHVVHSGAINVTIHSGTFNNALYNGSLLKSNTYSEHSGDITVNVQGVQGKLLTMSSHLVGSSCIEVTTVHSGDTKVYLKDLYTAAFEGFAKNFTAQRVFGGCQITNGTMSGDSELHIMRSNISGGYEYCGGSRMDGKTSVMSGTSLLVIDANKGLVYDEATEKYVETEGENGFVRFRAPGHGGSLINGYINSSTFTSESNQTGASSVKFIGPEDRVANDLKHQLTLAKYYVAGGSYFNGDNVCVQQVNDSSVYIEGYVDADSSEAPFVYGGSYYYNNASRLRNSFGRVDNITSNAKIVCDGTFEPKSASGSYVGNVADSHTVELFQNMAYIVKSGTLSGGKTLGGNRAGTNATVKTTGIALVEIWGEGATDGMEFSVGILGVFPNNGSRCLKLVGEFNAVKNQGSTDNFDISTNLSYTLFDYSQAEGDSFNYKRTNGQSAYSSSFERINSRKNVFIVSSDSAISNNEFTGTKHTYVAGEKFADILATSGIKIYTNYDPSLTNTKVSKVYTYADYIKYDIVSEAPNAFKFYMVDDEGNAVKEITTVGAATDKYIVKSGTVQSYVTSIENTTLTTTVNKVKENTAASGFSIRVSELGLRYRAKISDEFLNAYIANVAAVDGFKIKEFGIKVSATINGTPLNTKAVAWANGAMSGDIGGGKWHTENDDGYNYYAAVIKGFDNTKDRMMTDFVFNAYYVYEDINGEAHVVELGATTPTSIYTVAEKISTSTQDDVVAWYNDNKAAVDAIITICEA